MLFFGVEPFGSEANFLGHAIVAQTVANVNRTKGSQTFKTEDFMPRFRKQAQSVDEMIQVAEMLTAAFGGQDMRGDE